MVTTRGTNFISTPGGDLMRGTNFIRTPGGVQFHEFFTTMSVIIKIRTLSALLINSGATQPISKWGGSKFFGTNPPPPIKKSTFFSSKFNLFSRQNATFFSVKIQPFFRQNSTLSGTEPECIMN